MYTTRDHCDKMESARRMTNKGGNKLKIYYDDIF